MAYNTRYRAEKCKLEEISAEELPAEMFYQIFKHLDKRSLKKSREVCKSWRNNIDDSSKLMKSLTVNITSINKFLQSNLATKVKSVCFTLPLAGKEELLEKFFTKIGPTVEKVILKFGENRNLKILSKAKKLERQKLMFSVMLRFCTKLSSLTINGTDDNYNFVKNCAEDPRNILGLSTIKDLSINARTFYLEDLFKFVINLPNLHRLILNFNDVRLGKTRLYYLGLVGIDLQKKLYNLVLEYLGKYNGKLQEILFEEEADVVDAKILIKLLLMVGQLYPHTNVKCQARLNTLVNWQESEDIQVNQQNCGAIKAGWVVFHKNDDQPSLDTSRIGFCTNLQSLDIIIRQDISSVNLEFIEALKKLEVLRIIRDFRFPLENNFQSPQLLSGIPSLTKFELRGIQFENSFPYHLHFPTLAKLYLRDHSIVLNEDFIYNLTHLDQLRSLTFEHIAELTDAHLTRAYDFSEAEDGKISKLPAIAGFKSLKSLHIADCYKLTDNCLINGLSLCNKLDKITLCYLNDGPAKSIFTGIGLNALQQARNYIVEDLPPASHARKHSKLQRWVLPATFKRFTIRRHYMC